MGVPLGNQREEYLRLLVEVHGANAVPMLEQNLANLGREVTNLRTLQQQGAITAELLAAELQRVSRESAILVQQLDRLRGRGGISGQGVLGLAYAIQDVTAAQGDWMRAIYNVQNNIPVLLYQLGLGPGLAGTISLVSLGLGLAIPKIYEFGKSLFDTSEIAVGFKDKLKVLEEEVKKLEKIEIKTNVDARDLEILRGQIEETKKGIAALKQLRDELPATQRESGRAFRETFAELAPGGPAAATAQLVGRTFLEAKAAAEAPGGQVEVLERQAAQYEANAAAAEASGERGGAAMAREYRRQAAALRKQIQLTYRTLREASQQAVGREAEGAARGETPMIEAFAARAERFGMGPLGTALRTTTQEQMTATKEEEAEFQRGIDERRESVGRRRANRNKRNQDAREAERAEGEASDQEAHEFQREIDDRKFKIDMRNMRRNERRRQQRDEEQKARQEAIRISHATTLDERLEEAALAGRPRAAVREEVMRAQPGIPANVVDELLNRANEAAKLQTMEAGGDPHEALRRLEERQNRKMENQQADFMRSQVKQAIMAGAYGPEAASLPEQTIDQDVKKIVSAVQHGQDVNVAAVQTLHQSITAMEQMVMTNQALLYGYSDVTTRLNYIQQQLQAQDNYLRNPMNAAQQQQLGWGR